MPAVPPAPSAPLSAAEARALLEWHAEMGVDIAIGDAPVDRLALSQAQAAPAAPPVPPSRPMPSSPVMAAAPSLLTAPPDEVALAAREQARAAPTLDALRAALERFEGCALRQTASRLVFGDGADDARIMFIGEAPGREEDMQGLPFVGRSGQLLNRMLAAIGLDRGEAYVANIVPWRPPGNRTPTPQEVAICRPFLERQIELVDPRILVCLGAPSAQAMLGSTEGILRLRGRWLHYDLGTRVIPAMATLHPAYLLRQPAQKRLAWRDFRAIKAALETDGPVVH